METPVYCAFVKDAWEAEIRRVYATEQNSTAADGIIALQNKLGWIYEDKSAVFAEKWEEIRAVLADSPTPAEVVSMLASVDLPLARFAEMYSEEKLADGVRYAKDLKDRYTVLWLYEDVKRK